MSTALVESLAFAYRRGSPIFTNVNLRIGGRVGLKSRGGVVTAVMGASGCGKTSLLKLLAGIESPINGSISFDPSDAVVSYVPQEPVLFEHMTRLENARYYEKLSVLSRHFRNELFETAIDRLGLRDALTCRESVSEMSGGERQRLSLLRAVSVQPQVLLFDEPCTGLDVPLKQDFLLLLRQMTDELGLLTVYVTHHPEEVKLIADDLVFLSRSVGSPAIIRHAKLEEFIQRPPTVEAARFFANPAVNVIPCRVKSKLAIGLADEQVVELTGSSVPADGNYQLVFPLTGVKWLDRLGIPVKCVGRSPNCTIGLFDGDRATRLVGPRFDSEPTGFEIVGDALLFDEGGDFVQSVTVGDGG